LLLERLAPAWLWLGLLLLAAAPVVAQTVHVDAANCSGPGNGSAADPFCSIQTAICDLRQTGGGEVRVHPGTYNESLRMFPGISVISTDGPRQTTIDATGRPCTTSACAPSADQLRCSAVVWGSGATNADRLEGFRITGGSGLFRNFGKAGDAVVGGGIFVFGSSPTISNNVIQDNALFNKSTHQFWGGGIYLGGGSYSVPTYPVITHNVIENNVAAPRLAHDNPYPVGYDEAVGGGIYVGIYTAPTIRSNLIQGNQAGTGGSKNSVGGGIAVYSIAPEPVPSITRNVIRANFAEDLGGGIFFGRVADYFGDAPTRGLVDSNLIELNEAEENGGGLLAHTSAARIHNNTLVDNFAEMGGGMGLYSTDGVEPALVNNIVAFNTATAGGQGGGGVALFTAPRVFHDNDFYGNTPQNIGGEKSDAEYIGSEGNLSLDPRFASRIAESRDLRLLPDSPLIDAGHGTIASDLDLDGLPRVLDGDGDGQPAIDIGALEYAHDSDGDGRVDLLDDDDDNDGVTDSEDCAALSAALSRAPAPIGNTLRLAGSSRLWWERGYQGHTSDLYSGALVPGQHFGYTESCLAVGVLDERWLDPRVPAPGTGFYYLVASRNACGTSTAHVASDGTGHSAVSACPRPRPDRDTDQDGITDLEDSCPAAHDPLLADRDGDFVGDACDPCPYTAYLLPDATGRCTAGGASRSGTRPPWDPARSGGSVEIGSSLRH